MQCSAYNPCKDQMYAVGTTAFPRPFASYDDEHFQDATRTGCDPVLWGNLASQKYKIYDNLSDHMLRGPLLNEQQLDRKFPTERGQDQLQAYFSEELKGFGPCKKPEGLYGSLRGYPESATRECDSHLWAQMGVMRYNVGGLLPEGRWRLAEPPRDGELWQDNSNAERRHRRERENALQTAELQAKAELEKEMQRSQDLQFRIQRDTQFHKRELDMRQAELDIARRNAQLRCQMQMEQERQTCENIALNQEVASYIDSCNMQTMQFKCRQEQVRRQMLEQYKQTEATVRCLQNDVGQQTRMEQLRHDERYRLQLEQEWAMQTSARRTLETPSLDKSDCKPTCYY